VFLSDFMADFANEMPAGASAGFAEEKIGSISINELTLPPAAAAALGKSPGRYYTLTFDRLSYERQELAEAMHKCIGRLITFIEGEKAMVIGLGNESLAADRFGSSAAKGVRPSPGKVFCILPGVEGTTGIDSAEYIRLFASYAAPDAIVLLDAMHTSSPNKLLESIQISDTPLEAGSGLGKRRESLKGLPRAAKVLSIGYATTAYLKWSDPQSGKLQHRGSDNMVITPADCDAYVQDISGLTAEVLNAALSPTGGSA